MDVQLIFKIAAVGIIVTILNQVLVRSGREEQATMTTLAGLVVVLMIVAQKIAQLFDLVQSLLQVAGLGLIAVLLGLVLKKGNGVLALLLTLAACAAMTVSIVRLAEPVVSFLSELRQLAGLEPALLQPLLRTVGIGLLTQLTASVCADAGESTVARLIELCGSVLGIYTALPLLEAVLSLLRTMLEG